MIPKRFQSNSTTGVSVVSEVSEKPRIPLRIGNSEKFAARKR
jgi:hypothetical protein